METTTMDPSEIKVSSFMDDLKRETDAQQNGPAPEPEKPRIDPNAPKDALGAEPDGVDTEERVVADLVVGVLTFGCVMGCQAISGETNEALFKVTQSQKNEVAEPLAKVFSFYKIRFSPYWLLLLAVIMVYGPMFNTAFNIKMEKEKIKAAEKKKNAAANATSQFTPPAKPGRPSNAELARRRAMSETVNHER